MIKSKAFRFTVVVMFAFVGILNAQFSGAGAGTQDSPYPVANATQLNQARNFLGNPNVDFKQIDDINLAAGVHNVVWNGRDDNNKEVGSGIYFYQQDDHNQIKNTVTRLFKCYSDGVQLRYPVL